MKSTRLRATVLTLAAMTVALSACGAPSTTSTPASMPMAGGSMSGGSMSGGSMASSAAGPASAPANNDQDVSFANDMIMHHQQAVAMAALATGRSTNTAVLTLADQIKSAQGPEITTMTAWMKSWKANMSKGMPGMDMSASMPGMMSGTDMKALKRLKGTEFDRKFLTMMIAHHQGAITMASTEQARGASTHAKALAQKITTAQSAEIQQMHKLLG